MVDAALTWSDTWISGLLMSDLRLVALLRAWVQIYNEVWLFPRAGEPHSTNATNTPASGRISKPTNALQVCYEGPDICGSRM